MRVPLPQAILPYRDLATSDGFGFPPPLSLLLNQAMILLRVITPYPEGSARNAPAPVEAQPLRRRSLTPLGRPDGVPGNSPSAP